MTKVSKKSRILALDIRLRRVGFAVMDESIHLLDWGIRRWRSDADSMKLLMDRIEPLIALYSPAVVLLKDLGPRNRTARKKIIASVKKRLMRRSIVVQLIPRSEVRKRFWQCSRRNKYEIAAKVAEGFPELKWKLPQKRRIWQTEPYNATIFDAVALVLTHLAESSNPREH